jgi:hypothetical protein
MRTPWLRTGAFLFEVTIAWFAVRIMPCDVRMTRLQGTIASVEMRMIQVEITIALFKARMTQVAMTIAPVEMRTTQVEVCDQRREIGFFLKNPISGFADERNMA